MRSETTSQQALNLMNPQDLGASRGHWRNGLAIEHLWLFVPIFVLLWRAFNFPLPVLDFWWHLKMGEVIASTRAIPRVDLFSFTMAGHPFVVQNWLGELVLYWTYQLGGFPLLVFFFGLIALFTFILVYKLCLAATSKLRLAIFVALLAAVGTYSFSRPQTFSFLFFAIYYFVLTRYRERRSDVLWLLPALMALWVNIHGAFALGLGLVALYIVSESIRRLVDVSRTDALEFDEIRKLVLLLFLCGAATLLNPETYKVYDYIRTVVSDPASQQYVMEWQPPAIKDIQSILIFYAPLLIGLFTFMYSRVKPDLTEIAIFFGFGLFGMTAIRNAGWFTITAYPIITRYLPLVDFDSLLPSRFHKANRIVDWLNRPDREPRAYSHLNTVIACVALIALIGQSPWIKPALARTSLLDPQTPVGAANFIEQSELTGRIFHPQIYGDYLIWRLWPKQKSFFDGRVHLFDVEFVRQNIMLLHDSHWEDLLARWDIQYILLSKGPGDNTNLKVIESARNSSRWKKLYEDDVSILFEKLW